MPKIAVYFPGIGYHCDKPLLYYSRKIACGLGYEDYRNVSYTYKAENIRGNNEKMTEAYEALLAQTEAELADIVWTEYDDVLFVSKSIGTIIAASYAEKYGLTGARHILYTPLAQTYLFAPRNAIAFIGTADPWSNIDEIIRLSKANHIPLTVYEGCNHSLECDDTLRNLETIRDVMQKAMDFCKVQREHILDLEQNIEPIITGSLKIIDQEETSNEQLSVSGNDSASLNED